MQALKRWPIVRHLRYLWLKLSDDNTPESHARLERVWRGEA